MFPFKNAKSLENESIIQALEKSNARVEFDLNGNVISANENFLTLMGYSLAEALATNHRAFVDDSYRASNDYTEFWKKLRRGEYQSGQFKRITKDGRVIWLEAAYNPILKPDGTPTKIVKYATDVTKEKEHYLDLVGKYNAIMKSQAVIEFKMDGTILTANDNFLKAMGYNLAEIVGKHHGIFVDPAYRASQEYRVFWETLQRGEFLAAQYRRIGKGGREVWIEGSYNPILNADGKPVKVVKFATDITKQIALLGQLKTLIDVNFAEIDQAVTQSTTETATASSAAMETSGNVQLMAASAEEMAASITEISQSMTKSQTATDGAFDQVVSAGDSAQRLSAAAVAMGGIVGLIQTIAGQINLLALNATIESARAGDAGKGFAVVAGEVKNLANQAARATEQISAEIEGIQAISNDVVSSLGVIRQSIGTVRDHVTATAAAVEEQSAVTRDMSGNMQNAAGSVDTISRTVATISASIQQIESAVGKTKDAASILAR
ncbi:methyl-accepting chemotaxis protein [Magnetospirillum fulvum]|uniref:Methyl-accepting chemotaxis protein n=1 Tax=Magnetospirillum fulvum MGU-K5 TaxID=1316936 RepID=S9SG62_MAGFU|nr:PAS domain-containing methyl-accepting chemotaxis protein [Magnetospirillum fulvum]EPY03058.1 methyl-accepting chemotaxis protein [Magnetospirillum fulvum MGU-K5]